MSLHSGAPEKPRIIEEDDRPGPPPLMSEERTRGKGLAIIAAVLAVAAFAGVVWYAYDQGRRIGSETAAPLIKADTAPTKVRPDSPGGMQVPHQDKLVLNDLGSGTGADSSRVERLLPPPETPVPAPEPLADAAATAAPKASAPIPPASAPSEAAPKPAPSASSSAEDNIPPASLQPAEKTAEAAPKALVPPPPPATKVATAEAKPAPKPEPAPAPTSEPAAAPKPAAKGDFNIQIAALRSRDAAEKEWARVQSRNKSLLGGLSLTIQQVTTDNGVFYRVRGGPLTESAAKEVCAALKAKGQACLAVSR